MKTEHKCAYTCSLSSFSLLISRSFICNCSCCCWMSSKCSNKSCRNWVNSPTTSILWLLPSQAISGSDGLTNGTSVLGCSCSFCVSLLLLPFFRAIEDFDRKTRVTCRSDRELAEPVANLFPTKGASVFVWFWSMFPVQGKSVVITIWQTLVHVLSNTALKLFRFIRVKNSHYGTLAVHVTKTWRTTRMRGSRCSRELQMSFPVWSLKMSYFPRLFKIKHTIIWKNNTSCSETYTALTHFEFNKLTKTVCDKMTLFPVVMAWNGVTGYLAGRGACLCISG